MSQKEFQRVKVIENAVAGRLKVSEAARLLQLSERQVQRLKRRYRPDSVAWVQHGNRGRPMPWALPAALRRTILELGGWPMPCFLSVHTQNRVPHSSAFFAEGWETVKQTPNDHLVRPAQNESLRKARPSPTGSRHQVAGPPLRFWQRWELVQPASGSWSLLHAGDGWTQSELTRACNEKL
jgi:hypothetical protein